MKRWIERHFPYISVSDFTQEEEEEFQEVLKQYMDDEVVQVMKNFIQHGAVSTYDHCVAVARTSYILNKKLGEKADLRTLLVAALLHDFYLYDWHEKELKNKIHGFTHPTQAAKNAVKHFDITKEEQEIIRSHMWPLTVTNFPKSREAWIVCVADKYCSGLETLFMR